MDVEKLREAINAAHEEIYGPRRGVGATAAINANLLDVLRVAALSTLPREPEDHVIVCRDKARGEISIWKGLGGSLMSRADAEHNAKQWESKFPHTAYTVVKVA